MAQITPPTFSTFRVDGRLYRRWEGSVTLTSASDELLLPVADEVVELALVHLEHATVTVTPEVWNTPDGTDPVNFQVAAEAAAASWRCQDTVRVVCPTKELCIRPVPASVPVTLDVQVVVRSGFGS